jgi:hypothetical protein
LVQTRVQVTPVPEARREPFGAQCSRPGRIWFVRGRQEGRWKWLGLRKFSGVRYPGEPLSFEASPALLEPQHRLPQLTRLPPRWLRSRSNIRTHQRAINSAATALCSRSRTPARWSTVKSVRQAGVNSGSKRQAERGRSPANSYTKRRGTPAVTASPCPHAPQIKGAYETIYRVTIGTAFQ